MFQIVLHQDYETPIYAAIENDAKMHSEKKKWQFYFKKCRKRRKILRMVRERKYVNGTNTFKYKCTSNNQMLLTDGTLDTLHSTHCFDEWKLVNTQIPMGY
jgi:hypothetical protein